MALSSMTGFARSHGVSGPYAWAWEIKSVNGKGLDVRLRLPSGWDAIEAPVRARAAERLARGSIQAILTVEPRASLSAARARTGASIASQPGGKRSRTSRPLPLTDLISQTQA